MTEEDEMWKPDQRETFINLHIRIDNFLLWTSWNQLLQILSEKQQSAKMYKNQMKSQHLLVVSHGVWMECLFKKYYPQILQGEST